MGRQLLTLPDLAVCRGVCHKPVRWLSGHCRRCNATGGKVTYVDTSRPSGDKFNPNIDCTWNNNIAYDMSQPALLPVSGNFWMVVSTLVGCPGWRCW
jgi:hypothetical protein